MNLLEKRGAHHRRMHSPAGVFQTAKQDISSLGRIGAVQDSSEVGTDTIIAACDMRHTLFSLLDGSRVDPLHSELMESRRVYTPFVQVSFGVDMDFSCCIDTLL